MRIRVDGGLRRVEEGIWTVSEKPHLSNGVKIQVGGL